MFIVLPLNAGLMLGLNALMLLTQVREIAVVRFCVSLDTQKSWSFLVYLDFL